jgi:hypothetical protein
MTTIAWDNCGFLDNKLPWGALSGKTYLRGSLSCSFMANSISAKPSLTVVHH